MKNVLSLSFILSALFILVLSCSKSNGKTSPAAAIDFPATIQKSSWILSSITQRSENKTGEFQGYVFTFSSGGVLKAEKSGEITSGTWLYTPAAVVYYGATGSSASIYISLASTAPLSRLNKRWNIDSVHTSASTLTLMSPEIAEQESVIFSRQ